MTDDRSDPASLSAEYALGLLTGAELDEARRRAASEPAFAAEVARWRGRLAPLHEETNAIDPPRQLWQRIEQAMAGDGAGNGGAANDNVSALRRGVVVWRSVSGAMTAIAAALAFVLVFNPPTRVVQAPAAPSRPAPAPMVAMLSDQGAMKVVASWDPAAKQLVLAVPGDMSTDPNHSHELWVIPEGGKPRSLGTMSSEKQMHVQLANTLATLLQQGATIAISVEPRGGSPTGAPTGPVIASGALHRA